jgi:alkanesulfonate monooxygenase SsuD/methylene tetrahydromethanopterin reductase-like flavin-dependent oxidoreductase (luciferase family)
MKVGISLTTNYPDVKDPREGARWIIERAAAARRAALDSLFVGDQHVSPTPYYQNTPILGRLLAEWGEAPAGCLFLLPLWHPVLVAEQIGTLAAIAHGPFIMQCGLGRRPVRRDGRQHEDAAFGFRGSSRHSPAPPGGRNREFLRAVPGRRSEPRAASS